MQRFPPVRHKTFLRSRIRKVYIYLRCLLYLIEDSQARLFACRSLYLCRRFVRSFSSAIFKQITILMPGRFVLRVLFGFYLGYRLRCVLFLIENKSKFKIFRAPSPFSLTSSIYLMPTLRRLLISFIIFNYPFFRNYPPVRGPFVLIYLS